MNRAFQRLAGVFVFWMVGCIPAAGTCQDRSAVSAKIQERTGHGIRSKGKDAGLPARVNLEDGLSDEEAVAIALWNNAGFQAELARLGIARAELTDTRFWRNPAFSLLFPLGPKQLEATVSWPIDQLWLRPRRLRIAQKDLDRISETLVQEGLNLAREVRVAYADAQFTAQRHALAEQRATIIREIAEITQARVRAGDISELEATRQQTEVAMALEQASRSARDAKLAMERLRGLLGWSETGREFQIAAPSPGQRPLGELAALLKDALAARPDVRAAELAVEAAAERARLEKSRIFALTAMLDINAEGREGFEAGPGLQGEAPLFSLNQGGRDRARAELEAAMQRYTATRNRVAQEVRESVIAHEAARASARRWRDEILPRARQEAELARKAYEAGDASYLAWLTAQRVASEAASQAAEAEWEMARTV